MNNADIICLHRIKQLPLDANAEIFRQYPAFKLGVADSVRHYARLLLPLVKRLIASDSEDADWIFTAPAIAAHTPAAANLLCWELFDLYLRERDMRISKGPSLIDLQYDSEPTASIDWKDPTKSQDYAKLDFADRVTERERSSRRLVRNPEFHGRSILFVNDMCVTGAQQHTMQQYFERAEVACVRWLYVIAVDQEIGRSNPELEWQINFAPFDDLLRMVSREQIQFTAKCVQRLMHLSIAELDQVLRALSEQRRTRLLELAVLNGFQNLDGVQEQMKLVRSYGPETATMASHNGKDVNADSVNDDNVGTSNACPGRLSDPALSARYPMTTQQTSLRSLRIIEKLPIDYGDDFFGRYPLLKLGAPESVAYYGAQLSRLAEDLILQSLPESNDWVITGPAYNVLPGGPNLLCSYIYEDLKNKLPDSITLSLVPLRVETDNLEIKDSESLSKFHNYSAFTQQERNQLYEQSPEPLIEPDDFRGRSILFVNDIKVTGAHQRYLNRAFVKVNSPQICWLYVLAIAQEIAEAEPEIEYEINHSRIATFEEFADLLATHNLEYTSRCITRLLSYELSKLSKLFQMLDVGRKKAILELATAEGRFSGDYFKEKIDLLKSCVV